MSAYFCSCCNYDAKVKSSYTKHIKTTKHKKHLAKYSQKIAKNSQKFSETSDNIFPHLNENQINEGNYECKYCDKVFKHQSSLSKHIKYSCKKNKDED